MSILIPVDITEDVVQLVAMKRLGGLGPGGTNPEALYGWILKLREDSKKFRTSVEIFGDWLANQIPPWESDRALMSDHLIALDNQLGVRSVDIR